MTREESAEYLAKKISTFSFRYPETEEKYSELDLDIVSLYQNWKYEFSDWCDVGGFIPLSLVDEANYSEPYAIERMLVFELLGGKFATVIESGCIWSTCRLWATVDIHGSLQSALDSFQLYKREHE